MVSLALSWVPVVATLAIVLMVLLCMTGVVMSCLSLSGTWLVASAAVVGALMWPDRFPGWVTVGVFLALAAGCEGLEAIAGAWGVKNRGGSNVAGFLAMAGGLVGMVLGATLGLIGSLAGMLIGSFLPVYLYERRRLRQEQQALSVAWGAVVARVLVILLKVAVSLGMSVALLAGMLMS